MTPNMYKRTHFNVCLTSNIARRNRLGDLRRCEHGKIQIMVDVPPQATWQGPAAWYWVDISRFWQPVLYRRAAKLLDEAQTIPVDKTTTK